MSRQRSVLKFSVIAYSQRTIPPTSPRRFARTNTGRTRHVLAGEDLTLSALARDWAEYFTSDCDYELRAILAGAALEHKRRNLKICKPWLDDLSVL